MKTTSVRSNEINRDWFVVDAEGQTLGRLASEIAQVLRGKKKPSYTPHKIRPSYTLQHQPTTCSNINTQTTMFFRKKLGILQFCSWTTIAICERPPLLLINVPARTDGGHRDSWNPASGFTGKMQ